MSKVEHLWRDKEYMEKVEALNDYLNQEPNKEWIRVLPGTAVKYIPIERMEWLMADIFGEFRYDIKSLTVIEGSVTMVVTVRFFNPVTGVWDSVDGCGAAPIDGTNGDMAVALAVPAAKTFAVKDAVEPLGKIFGKDLNRADQVMYDRLSEKTGDKEALTKKFIMAIRSYKGKDKAALQNEVMVAMKNGWPDADVERLSGKLKVV